MLALGLMSGTSLDGVDAALVETDGEAVERLGPSLTVPYPPERREALRAILGGVGDVAGVERDLTLFHAEVVKRLLREAGVDAAQVGLIGFHGHTIAHRPEERRTWQIGDGALLAAATGITVVNEFRSDDVAQGGQGAPLVPVFHRALAQGLKTPLAVLNLGGVGNITWIGKAGIGKAGIGKAGIGADGGLLAFDTGPGNALIDDWMLRHTGKALDDGGSLAATGRMNTGKIAEFLTHPYFARTPPKSLDRDDFAAFAAALVAGMEAADGAATLAGFTAAAVSAAARHFPAAAERWLICGGGRHNKVIMMALTSQLGLPVEPVEAVGWDGDAMEAQAFAFLAVRAARGLPITYPETTGAPRPLGGGRVHRV
ncbi:anhydro-N-acetylmuramic acid kinase [Paramagnetospirillum kuznetsovii]|uniref:Anhydro-N-acetylmuramic acid kinase n=1 Tax=Paramagnetospirillum kuznetsovii TaxID=2053833 RepID=A0A364NWK2_9PROT|nr:anhydro-N-acetylmuramic acid kinase [Paramagnetospirillum kuznetsovii]RAU21458.1 anhydro-N-acetylmuramic acid kinase [Paramagnetospirillum kuznetsovii]